jgi:2,3-bisphosphoglycerate-dependent phosphoglycerate mutase
VRRAFFARHGESEYSARGLLNGEIAVACGLTPAGLEQSRALGEALRDEPIDLCVTTEFERVRLTADEALRDRVVPRLVVSELNDPLYGPFEGHGIDEYRAWAAAAPSSESPGVGGESRRAVIERYARGFRLVLERAEGTLLVVAHSLPISYLLGAREGAEPGARAPFAPYATPYELGADELERAIGVLERWVAAPSW